MMKTQDCGSLRAKDIGKRVKLAGWVRFYRDHGGVRFIDLADAMGSTQTVFVISNGVTLCAARRVSQ